jgi:hypothetical protein
VTKAEFLTLMRFPVKWLSWNLYPEELFEADLGHPRNGLPLTGRSGVE